MRKKACNNILNVVLVMSIVLASASIPSISKAKTKTALCPTNMYCDGQYVYVTNPKYQPPLGIKKINTKTGKVSTVISPKYKGKMTNGFKDIFVKGNYIYGTWDQIHGSGFAKEYIYRINIKTKKATKLATGHKPVLVGNKIYYVRCKNIKNSYPNELGMGSMNLNGVKKRNEKKMLFSSNTTSPATGTASISTQTYCYFVANKKSIKCVNQKKRKCKTIFKCSKNEKIYNVMAHKNAVIIDTKCNNNKMKVYYITNSGQKKKCIRNTTMCN